MPRPVALVTGPTSGLGLSFARLLAERGYDLVLVSRDQQRLDQLATELRQGGRVDVQAFTADLTTRDGMALVEARLAGGVDLLVNNAGFGLKGGLLDNSVDDEQRMLDILVTAVLRLTHAALGPMVERGSGSVINVSSVSAYLPRGSYGAAKGYVLALSKWADLAYRDGGVRVMAVLPGFTRTEFHQRMDVSRGSAPAWLWLEPDRVVRDALADLDRGRAISIPSRRYKLLVALARFAPASLQARFQRVGRR